jgi:geranyl-CoA carboxylase beta subunit
MGGAQAAQVMRIVTAAKMAREGKKLDEAALAAFSEPLRQRIDQEASVLFGTARLWDDGVIDPRDTRRILALCLDLAAESARRTLHPNTFGVARL